MIGFSSIASAALLVYEPFDYPSDSQLIGQNGGLGFTGAWRDETVANSATIQATGLTYPGLPTSGNSVLMTAETDTLNIFRDFPNIAGGDGTTTWISFLGQRQGPEQDPPEANPYPRGVNVGFFNTEHPDRDERMTIGNSSGAATNAWSLIPTGAGSAIVQTTVPYTDQAWAVLRIDHLGDDTVNDNAYLFMNPDPAVEPDIGSADASSIGAFDYSGLDFLRPFIGNTDDGNNRPFGELLWDELRIGTTYADMSAVPEPGAFGLLAIGGLALLIRRLRR